MIPIWVRVALLAVAFVAGWGVNDWRLNGVIKQMQLEASTAALESEKKARAIESEYAKKLQEAQNAAAKRETTLRADAAGARNAVVGLRDQLAEIRRNLPEATIAACRVRADALADVFGQCAARYSGLAETTDRHVNDKQTLIEAWPK